MNNIYDDKAFFDAYSRMARSTGGLEAAGEWHQLQPLFPAMEGSRVLDLGCGYGWHCKYAVEQGAAEALGLDLSEKRDIFLYSTVSQTAKPKDNDNNNDSGSFSSGGESFSGSSSDY